MPRLFWLRLFCLGSGFRGLNWRRAQAEGESRAEGAKAHARDGGGEGQEADTEAKGEVLVVVLVAGQGGVSPWEGLPPRRGGSPRSGFLSPAWWEGFPCHSTEAPSPPVGGSSGGDELRLRLGTVVR